MALDTLAQCKACLHLVFCCILIQRQRKSDLQLSMRRLKNQQSKLFQQLHNFKTRQRTLLTGTPLQNNLSELWMLLHFLDASKFQSLEDFEADFSDLSHGDQVCPTYKTAAHHLCFLLLGVRPSVWSCFGSNSSAKTLPSLVSAICSLFCLPYGSCMASTSVGHCVEPP